jgi:hypothetical protein
MTPASVVPMPPAADEGWLFDCGKTLRPGFNGVLKNKHQAASPGVRRFGKRSLFSDR